MKDLFKHFLDCLMAFAISFLSSILATDTITTRGVLIGFLSALLIMIIKFREYYADIMLEKNTGVCIQQTKTIFF